MGWSLKLGRIFGIDIKMHFSFILIVVWGALFYGGSAGPLYGVLVTLALFSLVLLHELGHSLAAMAYGIPVKDIILLPIGGVARLERMPEKPLQELVVALAGPLVNVVLAAILLPVVIGLGVWNGSFMAFTQAGLAGLLSFLLLANISLAVFNMIPAFPLDGGRVLRAILGFFTDYQKATKIAVRIGRLMALALGIYAIISGQIFLALIAFFIFIVGGQEGQAVAARGLLRRIQAGQIVNSHRVALSPHATIDQIAPMVMGGNQTNYAVLDPISGELLGVTTGQRVARALANGNRYLDITEVMDHAHAIPVVPFSATLDEVQAKLESSSNRVAAVYDGSIFRGLISVDDIYRAFNFLSQQRRVLRPRPV